MLRQLLDNTPHEWQLQTDKKRLYLQPNKILTSRLAVAEKEPTVLALSGLPMHGLQHADDGYSPLVRSMF